MVKRASEREGKRERERKREREWHTNLWQQQAIFVRFSDSSHCSATWDMVAWFVLFDILPTTTTPFMCLCKWCFIDSVWLSLDLLFSLIHNKNPLSPWLIVFIEFYSLMLLHDRTHTFMSVYALSNCKKKT